MTISGKKILAIIPARGGSKRIPRKNIKILAGKPLIAYTIEAALKSRYLDKVVVSTEDNEIAVISKKYGAEIIKRPKKLAKDDTPTYPVLEQAVNYLKEKDNYVPDIIVTLQPTSPLRNFLHINKAIEKFLNDKYDSSLSVFPLHVFLWEKKGNTAIPINHDIDKRMRTQDRSPEYKENGAIYITREDILMKKRKILSEKIGLYIMPEECSVDVDNKFDFWLVEKIIKYKNY
jgi:CMP-N,N'-diacetyllegionaminic acid synthase